MTETSTTTDAPCARPGPSWVLRLHACWPQIRFFALFGGPAIVVGGLVAAGSAPARSEVGAWAAAYLVLVGGVTQILIGTAQALLTRRPQHRVAVDAQIAMWNTGTVAVVIGTATGLRVLGDLGGLLLLVVLALSIRAVGRASGRAVWLYKAAVAALATSVIIGLILARIHPLE